MVVIEDPSADVQLENDWRDKLDAIRQLYETDPSPEVKARYWKLLGQFADLVLRGTRPPLEAGGARTDSAAALRKSAS